MTTRVGHPSGYVMPRYAVMACIIVVALFAGIVIGRADARDRCTHAVAAAAGFTTHSSPDDLSPERLC